MQLVMNNVIAALEKHWRCKSVIYRESPIVSIEDNYDRIGYPPEGASRDSRYTRYVCDTALLRTMTSAMIPRAMQSIKDNLNPDLLLVCPGICYRRDSIDRIHVGEPHQIDLWYLNAGKAMTIDNLREAIRVLINAIDPNLEWRMEERLHPYTLNGQQVDVLWNGEWLELLECGIAHPKVIKENIGRDDVTGIAIGPGLDRMLMIAKNIPDIRLLRSVDPRVATQMQDIDPYREVSAMPPVTRDLSIVVDREIDNDLLGDMTKEALGKDAEVIELINIISETSYDALPQAAKDRLGIDETQKNILLRVVLRALDRTLTSEECNEYRNRIYKALHKGTVASMA
jgi:phenylalanyl-tRNA synthetase alpha chain